MVKRRPVLVNHDAGSAWTASFVDIPARTSADDLKNGLGRMPGSFRGVCGRRKNAARAHAVGRGSEIRGGSLR
jgi:hypothetical protein